MSIIEVTVMERRQLKTKPPVGKILVYAGLVIWALIVLFPFYWMLLSSVKSYSAYNSEFVPQLFTLHPTFQNYLDAFNQVPLGNYSPQPCNFLARSVLPAGCRRRAQIQ